MTVSFEANDQLVRELGDLARDLGFSRAHLCRAILRGVLRDHEGIERWKDVVLGPRFAFCVSDGRPEQPSAPSPSPRRSNRK